MIYCRVINVFSIDVRYLIGFYMRKSHFIFRNIESLFVLLDVQLDNTSSARFRHAGLSLFSSWVINSFALVDCVVSECFSSNEIWLMTFLFTSMHIVSKKRRSCLLMNCSLSVGVSGVSVPVVSPSPFETRL